MSQSAEAGALPILFAATQPDLQGGSYVGPDGSGEFRGHPHLSTPTRSARDEAVAKADAATWDRLTTDDFTVVLADGTLLTKGERLAQFKTQQATPPAPAQQEQIKHYGDVFVRRALRQVRDAGAAWVLDIWVKDAKGWRVAAVQVTSAKK